MIEVYISHLLYKLHCRMNSIHKLYKLSSGLKLYPLMQKNPLLPTFNYIRNISERTNLSITLVSVSQAQHH